MSIEALTEELIRDGSNLLSANKPFPAPTLLNQTTILGLTGAFLFWLDLYLILLIFNSKRSPEWNCRLCTLFHGLVSAFLSFVSCFWLGPWPFSHIAQPCNNFQLAIILISLGYFLFDFSWCIWSNSEGPIMLLHHMFSISGFILVLCTGRYGSEIVATLGGSEVTNPFLQGRWFLQRTGHYNGKKEFLLDWAFVILFGVMRLGLGTPLTYFFLTNPNVILPARIGSIGIFSISLLFFLQLARFIYKKYISKQRRRQRRRENN